MKIKELLGQMTEELERCLSCLDEDQLQDLEAAIGRADRVFIAGAGRSLLMIRGLAMRLMHFGYTAYVVGDTTTPAICPGDLLLITSGSGETGSMKVMAEKCLKIGASLALITAVPDSTIGRMADTIVHVHTSTSKNEIEGNPDRSIQPGANAFEQCVLFIADAISIDLVSDMDLEEVNRILMERHANLE